MSTQTSGRSVIFLVPDARIDGIDRAWSGAYLTLARRLAAAGTSVTVAIAEATALSGNVWDGLREAGISVVPIPAPALNTQHVEKNAPQARAYRVYEWLKQQRTDVVHAPSTGGMAFYCLAAKRCAVALAETVFAIHAAPTALARDAARLHPVSSLAPLSLDHMERRSLEWADAVWSHVPATIESLRAHSVALTTVPAAVLPFDDVTSGAPAGNGRTVVVFGPIDRNSGIALLRDALARMPAGGRPDRVVIVGPRVAKFDADEFLHRKLGEIAFRLEIAPVETWEEARPLLDAGDLVVVLTTADWAARGVAHRLATGRPLRVLESSPLISLVDAKARARVGVPPNPNRLAAALVAFDRDCAGPPNGVPAAELNDWHNSLSNRKARTSPAGTSPKVTVCVIHHERPALLQQALASIRGQDWPELEVVLVDDGSPSDTAQSMLDGLEPEFAERGWKIVRQANAYLGAARNTAVRNASGEYVLFLDDDNVLKPGAVGSFVRAAEASGADIVTSFCDVCEGDAEPRAGASKTRLVFEGDNVALGLFTNVFGDSNALIRRDAFVDLGGNSEDYGIGKDDQEFFARAVLSGKRLAQVPEALYWYRISGTRLRHRHFSDNAGHFRVLRPYLETAPAELRPLITLAQGLALASRGGRRLGAASAPDETGSDDIRDLSQDLAFNAGSYRFVRGLYRFQISAFSALMRFEARLARRAARFLKKS